MIYFLNPSSHPNVGDIAIFYASLLFFKNNNLEYKIVNCKNYKNFNITKNDTIAVLGGGWIGIYECDITDFYFDFLLKHKESKIVFLPSSFFPVTESFKKITNLNATIFARDDVSYDNYKQYFKNANIKFCSDMVFSLPRISSKRKAEHDIGLYKRSDSESTNKINSLNGVVESRFTKNMKWIPFTDDIKTYEKIFLEFLYNMLKYKFIITDSLHVSIFSYLLYMPCLIIDNKYKKLSNTWKHYKNSCVSLYDENKKDDFHKYDFDYSDIKFEFDELLKEFK